MIEFYELRTNEHIERVRNCLLAIADQTPHAEELRNRAEIHDASKFEDAERIPYIWLTEFHRCRRNNVPFSYPNGMEALVKNAVQHHLTSNRHHPNFHADPNEMTDVDIIEMVCDWTAMSQEFNQDGGSARGWADKTIGRRVKFNDNRKKLIYSTIDLLDAAIRRGDAE